MKAAGVHGAQRRMTTNATNAVSAGVSVDGDVQCRHRSPDPGDRHQRQADALDRRLRQEVDAAGMEERGRVEGVLPVGQRRGGPLEEPQEQRRVAAAAQRVGGGAVGPGVYPEHQAESEVRQPGRGEDTPREPGDAAATGYLRRVGAGVGVAGVIGVVVGVNGVVGVVGVVDSPRRRAPGRARRPARPPPQRPGGRVLSQGRASPPRRWSARPPASAVPARPVRSSPPRDTPPRRSRSTRRGRRRRCSPP